MIRTFFTDRGGRVPAVTAVEMREIDRIAMEETGPNLFQMMENAGRNLALFVLEVMRRKKREGPVVVLAGTGGNGGGGICAARHLANREENVRLLIAENKGLGEVPAFQRHVYLAAGGVEGDRKKLSEEKPSLIVDALIGYSLKGRPGGAVAELIGWINGSGAEVVSLDVPSGVDATTGEAGEPWVRADSTLTLALPKTGLVPQRSGDLYLADIGIPAECYTRAGIERSFRFDERYVVPLKETRM
jgi:NAD(P)H-hydrate epimerase